jgi:hypothetical protein
VSKQLVFVEERQFYDALREMGTNLTEIKLLPVTTRLERVASLYQRQRHNALHNNGSTSLYFVSKYQVESNIVSVHH